MPSIAITGVIGSGKSYVLRKLATCLGATVFSADEENSRLLDGDERVREAIISRLGPVCYRSDGKADREAISGIIQADTKARAVLESILHPRIEEAWKPLAERHRHTGSRFFLAEIPLLYEKGIEHFFDKTIVVGCSDHVRLERLITKRLISQERARQWTSLQQCMEQKSAKADILLWNDGSEQLLERQIRHLSKLIVSHK